MLSISEFEVVFEELFRACSKMGLEPNLNYLCVGMVRISTPKYYFIVDYVPCNDIYRLSVSEYASNGSFRADFPTLTGITRCISFILNKSI